MIITEIELKNILNNSNQNNFLPTTFLPNFLINLHMHTVNSDGKMYTAEVFENAQKYAEDKNLDYVVISITDHDDIKAQQEAKKIANNYSKVKYVYGCELSVVYFDDNLNAPLDFELLLYGFNPGNKELTNLLSRIQKNRIQALPKVFDEFCVKFNLDRTKYSDFIENKPNLQTGKGCNFQYEFLNYFKNDADYDDMWRFLFIDTPKKYHINQTLDDILAVVKKDKNCILSLPHPARIIFKNKLKNISEQKFLTYFLPLLKEKGVQGLEIYYANYPLSLNNALINVLNNEQIKTEEERWIDIFVKFAKDNNMLMTGGNDNHAYTIFHNKWDDVFNIWEKSKSLIKQGYKVLDKEVTMGMPGPCMPAISKDKDIGIGSPYGDGSIRVHNFFDKIINKILLGPDGKTSNLNKHSPYCSEVAPNPFFIPLEYMVRDGLLQQQVLDKIYQANKNNKEINFDNVEKAFNLALDGMSEAQIEKLAQKYIKNTSYPYIGDIQVMIPNSIYENNKEFFLEDFTLGTPPDGLSSNERNWNFKVLNPDYIFNKNGSLGKGGKILYGIFDSAFKKNKGGLRIDHFIGFVNPYLCSNKKEYESARLYSSDKHPVFKKYAKNNLDDFAIIFEKIILKAANDNNIDISCIYPEDIGSRPPQMDYIFKKYNLGRLLVSEFVDIDDDENMYRLKNAKSNDVATIDTHDTASLQDFIAGLDDDLRYRHAIKLAQDLRFDYTDDLKSDYQLFRMKWAELLACPAKRVQAFFTSFIGQKGRYNQPGNPEKWKLRCDVEFDIKYFLNLAKGKAYNPFDAICLAIYAKSDDFYNKNIELVKSLRDMEKQLINRIKMLG